MSEEESRDRVLALRGGTGRADLVLALALHGRGSDADSARLLGFGEREPTEAPPREEASTTAEQASTRSTDSSEERERTRAPSIARQRLSVPLWRVVEARELDEAPASVTTVVSPPLTPQELRRRGGGTPATEPLAPWSRLGPRLHRAGGRGSSSGWPDP